MFEGEPAAAEVTAEGEQTDRDLILQLLKQQQEHRADVAALKKQIEKSKTPVAQVATFATPEELLEQRMAEVSDHSHYCPGCGALYNYQRECTGKAEAPHPPIEVVSTDELHSGDGTKHTPAPDTVNLG